MVDTKGAESLELRIQVSQTVPSIWINGPAGFVRIEYSTNLNPSTTWSLLSTVQAVNTPYLFTDSTAGNAPKRFYRAATENASTGDDRPHLVWIDPGTFTLGSPSTERDRNSDESPQTQVTISRGFAFSKYETTQAEYLAVMGNNPSSFSGDPRLPVEQVSWEDGTNFCAKLTARELSAGRLPAGYTYRLPTEAEWEYACRAGTTTATAYGNSLGSDQANFYGLWPYGQAALGPSLRTTARVGSYAPNAWGLYDMHGNVSELCLGHYVTYPGGSLTDPVWLDFSFSSVVNRGGWWNSLGSNCRSADRASIGAHSRTHGLGLRPVLIPGQPDSATAPIIIRQPQSQTARARAPVTFSVEAGGAPLFYQWRFSGGDIYGATDASYTIPSAELGDAGKYTVVVKNSAGRVTSQAAVLTIDPPENPDPVRLAWIAAGDFMMGSPAGQVDRAPDEGPQTEVTFSQGFWMSKHETTQAEYLAVMEINPSSFTGGLNRPVEMVSWDDASNYCVKLTIRERLAGRLPVGYEYRLPTEAEWEYACRAQTTTATAYGDSLSSTQANFNGNFPYGAAAAGPFLQTTTTVGSYAPNAWGLFDMHGNVLEWCSDWYGAYSGAGLTDPRGPITGSSRVIRGGGWNSSGRNSRSGSRSSAPAADKANAVGFRVVLASGQWNGGFEQSTLIGWKTSGDFSDWQPIVGDVLTVKRISAVQQQIANSIGGDYWRNLTYPVGHKGQRWLSTALNPAKGSPGCGIL